MEAGIASFIQITKPNEKPVIRRREPDVSQYLSRCMYLLWSEER